MHFCINFSSLWWTNYNGSTVFITSNVSLLNISNTGVIASLNQNINSIIVPQQASEEPWGTLHYYYSLLTNQNCNIASIDNPCITPGLILRYDWQEELRLHVKPDNFWNFTLVFTTAAQLLKTLNYVSFPTSTTQRVLWQFGTYWAYE